jgi:hypothetical protein
MEGSLKNVSDNPLGAKLKTLFNREEIRAGLGHACRSSQKGLILSCEKAKKKFATEQL